MATIGPIKWEKANFKWSRQHQSLPSGIGPSLPIFTWNDVALVKLALGGGGDEMPWTGWQGEKKKRLIKLICKVKGKTYKESKEIKNYKIKVSDIKLLAEKVLGIEVITENIKL